MRKLFFHFIISSFFFLHSYLYAKTQYTDVILPVRLRSQQEFQTKELTDHEDGITTAD